MAVKNNDIFREVGSSVSKGFVEGVEDALQNYNKGDGGVAKQSDLESIAKGDNPYIINLDIGLKRWRQSLGKDNTIRDIICLGDSILEGAGSADTTKWWTNSWLARLRKIIQDQYGNSGLGVVPSYAPYKDSQVNPGFWSYSAGWEQSSGLGFANNYYRSDDSGDSVTFTFTGEEVSIIMATGPSLTPSVDLQVDGGAIVNVSCVSGSVVPAVEFVAATGLSNAEHVLTITNQANSPLFLIGAVVKNSSDGIRVNMCGRSGISTSAYFDPNNYILQTTIDFVSDLESGDNLFIVALGSNDYFAQRSIDEYRSNLQAIIDRAKPFGDIILIAYGDRSDVSSPTIEFEQYVEAQKELALNNELVFIDVHELWGGSFEFMDEVLGYIADVVHPNIGGYIDIANIVKKPVLNERF